MEIAFWTLMPKQMQKILETNYVHAERNWDIHRLISQNASLGGIIYSV